jgi:undecaprenyl phosphate-alpha-L-ara4N flippase subunit ArnE
MVEAMGAIYLSRGLRQLGEVERVTPVEVARLIGRGATNGNLLLGVALEAIFFGALLYLLSQHAVSLIWPLTSLGFVLTAVAARFLLGEQIHWLRWCGIALIVAGAALVSYTDKLKPERAPVSPTAAPTRSAPQ